MKRMRKKGDFENEERYHRKSAPKKRWRMSIFSFCPIHLGKNLISSTPTTLQISHIMELLHTYGIRLSVHKNSGMRVFHFQWHRVDRKWFAGYVIIQQLLAISVAPDGNYHPSACKYLPFFHFSYNLFYLTKNIFQTMKKIS